MSSRSSTSSSTGWVSAVVLAAVVSLGCKKKHEHATGPEQTIQPSITPTPTADPTPTPTVTPTPTPTPTVAPSDGVDWDKAMTEARAAKPKQLELLPKQWSGNEVVDYMEKISAELGVECKFCHPKADFLIDHEHRTRAAEMITMQNELVKQFFKGKPEIGCITCHRGKAEPDIKFPQK